MLAAAGTTGAALSLDFEVFPRLGAVVQQCYTLHTRLVTAQAGSGLDGAGFGWAGDLLAALFVACVQTDRLARFVDCRRAVPANACLLSSGQCVGDTPLTSLLPNAPGLPVRQEHVCHVRRHADACHPPGPRLLEKMHLFRDRAHQKTKLCGCRSTRRRKCVLAIVLPMPSARWPHSV